MFTWFRRYIDFAGRSSRREYWLGILCLFVLSLAAGVVDIVLFDEMSGKGYGPVQVVVGLVTFLPALALSFRRLHDIGRTAWWILLGLIPILGGLVLLYWAVKPGQPAENAYGDPPPETPGWVDPDAEHGLG